MNAKQQVFIQHLALSSLILVIIGLAGCAPLEVGVLPADADSGSNGENGPAESEDAGYNGIQIGIEPTPMPETFTYVNDFYGFKFDYPETWTLKEKDHGVDLKQGNNHLRINFRWGDEDFNFGRTGMAAGTPIYSDKIIFMRETIPQYTVELDHRVQYVIYSGTVLVEVDDLVFGIILEDTLTDYNELDIPDEMIAEAKTILESFERIEATGTPGESSPAPEAAVINPVSPDADWLLYTNADYDFGFYYPSDMTVVEEPNLVKVGRDSIQLLIAYRNVNEEIQIVEQKVFAGEYKTYPVEEIDFLARELRVFINSYDERVKAVYFGDAPEQDDGSLVTAIHVQDTSVDDISIGAEIDERLIAEMTTIVKSFGRFETPSLPEVVRLDLGGDPIVAWLGHIASAPEGSRFDNMVVLSPHGTGQIGLTGVTPEIEAQINSLRDAEGPNEYVHLWGTLLACTIDNYEKNNCELVVERMQYGANYSEEEVHDWFGTIKKTTFNDGESYVFELFSQFPMWYGINASQDESLQFQLAHFFETGERVQMSGLLMVGVPDVNGTRIEISSIKARPGFMPSNFESSVYENREYGFQFTYPTYMSVGEETNKVVLLDGDNCQMTIAYRRAEEDTQITDVGEVAGQLKNYGEVYFLGSFAQVVLNIQDGYITAAYLGEPGVELGEGTPLRFVISMVNSEGGRLSNSQVDWMLQVFQNFSLSSD